MIEATEIFTEFRKYFRAGACANLGEQLMFIIRDYKNAVYEFENAKRIIAHYNLPLIAVGHTLGFHYHAIYIRLNSAI